MITTIYFYPEAYATSGPKLMGRNAAGESFLRGFLTHSSANEFWAQVQDLEHAKIFAQAVLAAGRSEPVKAIDKNRLAALAESGMVYFPGPGIGEQAWHRAAHGHGAWSLCGLTHTTSSIGSMDALAELLIAPVQPWMPLSAPARRSRATSLVCCRCRLITCRPAWAYKNWYYLRCR